MMAVQVEAMGDSFHAFKAQALFRAITPSSLSPYDVTPDGKRFVINTKSRNNNAPLTLVVNWPAALKR
jgi:hypothetical protein